MVAHIRHVYTDYDRLLKFTSFHEARGNVEHTTLAKVIEWRGDDENGQTVLEDVFREVIVISDDDDSDSEEDTVSTAARQSASVEILPTDPLAHEVRTQPINNSTSAIQDHPREVSEEAPPGFRFVTRSPAKDTINRRGFNRYQAWNRALQEYREGMQGSEQPRYAGASAEKATQRHSEQRIMAQEAPAARRQDVSPKRAGLHRRVGSGSASIDSQAHRALPIPLMDRQVAKGYLGVQDSYIPSEFQQKYSMHELNARPTKLTNQDSPELQILEEFSGPRNINIPPSQDAPQSRVDARLRRERLPPQSDRINAPVFVSGPKENRPKMAPLGRPLDSIGSPLPRPDSNTQDSILPSIETWPSESRRAEGAHPLVHMTNRMSLRSVTPGRLHGEPMHHPDAIDREGDSEHASKRRRLAYPEGSRAESRPGSRSARPVGLPVSDAFGQNSYRRVDSIPDHRPQDQPKFRRDYPPVEQIPLVGHQRERKPMPYPDGQHTLETRSVPGRQYIYGPREFPNQAGLSSASIIVSEGDRTFRAAPAVFHPGSWHPYHGDRSLRSDRVPKDLRSNHRTRIDGGHPLPENPQPDRKIYADGFVRHVDHREPLPFEYAGKRLELGANPNGDLSHPTRAKEFEYLGTKHLSQTPGSSDQRRQLPIGTKLAPIHEHVRTVSESGKVQPRVSPHLPHERPVSGGFTSLR